MKKNKMKTVYLHKEIYELLTVIHSVPEQAISLLLNKIMQQVLVNCKFFVSNARASEDKGAKYISCKGSNINIKVFCPIKTKKDKKNENENNS